MNKSDTERFKLTLSIDKKLADLLRQLSKETRIPQSRLVDEALEDLLKKHGKG
jgi:hypothetical protein